MRPATTGLLALLLVAVTPAAAAGPPTPSPEAHSGPAAGVPSPPDVAPASPLPMERAATAAPVRKGEPPAEPSGGTGEGDGGPAPSPAPPPEPVPEPDSEPAEPTATDGIDAHWLELARCESGNWHDGSASFSDPIRWDWGAPGTELPPWGTQLHHGGLQFAPSTWDWVAPDVLDDPPRHAYDATPHEQVAVAAEVQARQGWGAWPVCSRKVGLR